MTSNISITSRLFFSLVLAPLLLVANSSSYAGPPWYTSLAASVTTGDYQKQTSRRSFDRYGIRFKADYLEVASVSFAIKQTNYYYHGAPTRWKQTQYSGILGHTTFIDWLNGRLLKKFQFLHVSDELTEWDSFGADFVFTDYQVNYMLGASLARSEFNDIISKITATQFTTQLGKGLWDKKLWLNLRINIISTKEKNYQSLQPTITYYTDWGRSWIIPASITIATQQGGNRYMFDGTNELVYNTNDLQTSAYFATLGWNALDSALLYFTLGRENFETTDNNKYKLNYLAINLSKTW